MADHSVPFAQQLRWVTRQMPRTQRALQRLRHLPPARIAICTHLDIKMTPLFDALLAAGHQLFITTCDSKTVRDAVVNHLGAQGPQVLAQQGMSEADWQASLQAAIAWGPDYICEFGGALTTLYHHSGGHGLVAALEGTGSGINQLSAIKLSVPVINWDDISAKEGLHNRHMVGLTGWHTFFQRTHLTLHEKNVTVVGYGLVGQGIAMAGRAYGGNIRVVERDPGRRLNAAYDGWQTPTLPESLPTTDVLVTATGVKGVIDRAILAQLKDGAFVMNLGHGSGEIATHELSELPATEVMPALKQIDFADRHIYLLADGAMLNLAAGFGDSLNAFDVSLAILASGLNYMLTEGKQLAPGLSLLPEHAWQQALA